MHFSSKADEGTEDKQHTAPMGLEGSCNYRKTFYISRIKCQTKWWSSRLAVVFAQPIEAKY